MNILNYILYYGIIIPIALLPTVIGYGISNFLYVIVYKLFGYRKKVVMKNLQKSFPSKSQVEIGQIMDTFYSHFFDLVIESIQSFVYNAKQLKQKVLFGNAEIVDQLLLQHTGVIAVTGHYANWEWPASIFGAHTKHPHMVFLFH